jgi:uncharacterized protein YjbI with pentapeptide repeats
MLQRLVIRLVLLSVLLPVLVFVPALLGMSAEARAAAYLKTDGTIVDPILCAQALAGVCPAAGAPHPYAYEDLPKGLVYPIQDTSNNYDFEDFRAADLSGVDNPSMYARVARWDYADLSYASLPNAKLWQGSFVETNLAGADLNHAAIYESDMVGADLRGTDLSGCLATYANLDSALVDPTTDVSYTNFGYASFNDVDLSGVTFTSTGLGHIVARRADFSNAYMSSVSTMSNATLTDARFVDASMRTIDLGGADLSGADLTRVDATGTELWLATAANTIFVDADLTDTDLKDLSAPGADFSGAVFTGASVIRTDFSSASLAGATGLDTTTGAAYYDALTDFAGTGFDPVAAGWVELPVVAPPVPGLDWRGRWVLVVSLMAASGLLLAVRERNAPAPGPSPATSRAEAILATLQPRGTSRRRRSIRHRKFN